MSSYTPSQELIRRLAEEIRASGQQGLVPPDDAENIANALLGRHSNVRVQLFVPSQVTTNVRTQLADLSYARCTNCGRVYDLNSRPDLLKNPRCSKCGGSLVATPLWTITGRGVPFFNRRITSTQGIRIVLSVEEYSRARVSTRGPQLPTQILIRDRSRPIATLEFRYGSSSHQPDAIHRSRIFIYQLSLMPSESITKPVTITAFAYRESGCMEIGTTMGPFHGISKIFYCSDLEILQATLLYRAGHQRSSSGARVSVLDIQQSPVSGVSIVRVPARYIRTRGLVVKIDEESVRSVLEELGYRNSDMWIALHTVSHAFLVNLPQITGLEGIDFGEAISTNTNEIAVYDNSLGGLGGVEGIVDVANRVLDPNYEVSVRESYDCPLACTKACKACLFTDSCFMLNWRLDRRILERLGWRHEYL